MSRISLTTNLYLDEYIPEQLYRKYENNPQILIAMLDKRMVLADQSLRNKFGPETINNWWHGGDRDESGIRIPGHKHYSPTSQHAFGRASDKIFRDVLASEVRTYIKAHFRELGITAIEDNVSWVHSDTRWVQGNSLLVFKP